MDTIIAPTAQNNTASEHFDVLIVGAGLSGIGAAWHLQKNCPGKSYAILEGRGASGGTWDLFRYPGVRSDSDMFTLGFAFAPWREERTIADGEAILDYLDRVVDSHAIRPHIRFQCKVLTADWDSTAALWRVTLAGGEALAARFLFLGSGYYDYDNPHDPQISGIGNFAGQVIHPQFWPQDFQSAGKRIVIIGSGATAVTLVPALAGAGANVTMLQRTPSWYIALPSSDSFANRLRRFLPERWAYWLIRARNNRLQEFMFKRCRNKPAAMSEYLTKLLREQLGDAWNAKDFTPPYGPWEQRLCVVPDGDMFTAIKAGDVEVVTGRVARIEPDGIFLEDGRRIAADVIVTATGLKLAVAGKIAVSMDGIPVNFAKHFYYRDCMFSNLPNIAALFGYLNAGWTLRVDIVAERLCRMFKEMDARGMQVATPYLPENHGLTDDGVFDAFSSGYLKRGSALIPRSATTEPWRISMDYRADRKELRAAPISDGVVQFAPAPARVL